MCLPTKDDKGVLTGHGRIHRRQCDILQARGKLFKAHFIGYGKKRNKVCGTDKAQCQMEKAQCVQAEAFRQASNHCESVLGPLVEKAQDTGNAAYALLLHVISLTHIVIIDIINGRVLSIRLFICRCSGVISGSQNEYTAGYFLKKARFLFKQ